MNEVQASTDLLIVAGPEDRVAVELDAAARKKGHCPAILGMEESARLFSIASSGVRASVTPCVPILFRPPAPPVTPLGFDDGFLRSECFATLWAAASLMDAPVINRPSYFGIGGRVSISSAITDLRAGQASPRAEIFANDLPDPPTPSPLQWFAQSAQTFRTAAWPDRPEGGGPFRARWLEPNSAYEVVVVLRPDAWRCTMVKLDHLGLEARSVDLMERLDLVFGTVIWSVSPDLTDAYVARIDPFPSMDQVQFVWPALGPALLKTLFV